MLPGMIKNSVQIKIADGGYIIQWVEPKAPPAPLEHEKEEEEKPAYLQDEEQRLRNPAFRPGFRPWIYTNPARCMENKVAVRTDLAAALELVGQILGRLQKLEKDSQGP